MLDGDVHQSGIKEVIASAAFKRFELTTAHLPHEARKEITILLGLVKLPPSEISERAYLTSNAFVYKRFGLLYLFIFPIIFSSLIKHYSRQTVPADQIALEAKISQALDGFLEILDGYILSSDAKMSKSPAARLQQLLVHWRPADGITTGSARVSHLISIFHLWPIAPTTSDTLCRLLDNACTIDGARLFAHKELIKDILGACAFLHNRLIGTCGDSRVAEDDPAPAIRIRPLFKLLGSATLPLARVILDIFKDIGDKSAISHALDQFIRHHQTAHATALTTLKHEALSLLQPLVVTTTEASSQPSLDTGKTDSLKLDRLRSFISTPASSVLAFLASATVIAENSSYHDAIKGWAIRGLYSKALTTFNEYEQNSLAFLLLQPDQKKILFLLRRVPSNHEVRGWNSTSAGSHTSTFNASSAIRYFCCLWPGGACSNTLTLPGAATEASALLPMAGAGATGAAPPDTPRRRAPRPALVVHGVPSPTSPGALPTTPAAIHL